jgi:hypothetical protein
VKMSNPYNPRSSLILVPLALEMLLSIQHQSCMTHSMRTLVPWTFLSQ